MQKINSLQHICLFTILVLLIILREALELHFSIEEEEIKPQILRHEIKSSQANVFASQQQIKSSYIPLHELVQSNITKEQEENCTRKGDDYILFKDVVLPESITHLNQKIPRVIHLTGKSRCMSQFMHDQLSDWKKLQNYSLYYHDEDAVDRLLLQKTNIVPHLQHVLHCLNSGAGKADVWRYLLMWEYGGVYSDIDNKPGPLFEHFVNHSLDAFFLKEPHGQGYPIQFFFAVSKHHPIMYFTLQRAMERLVDLPNIDRQFIPVITGPGALKTGFVAFCNQSYPPIGINYGVENRSFVISSNQPYGRSRNKYILERDVMSGPVKLREWSKMSMRSYGRVRPKVTLPCSVHLFLKRNDKLSKHHMVFT